MTKCVCACVLEKVTLVLYWYHLMVDPSCALIQNRIEADLISNHGYFTKCCGHLGSSPT